MIFATCFKMAAKKLQPTSAEPQPEPVAAATADKMQTESVVAVPSQADQ